MHPRSPRHRRAASATALLAVVLAVATAAAACGGDAAERTEPPPTTSAPATDAPATTTAPTTVEPPPTTTAQAADTPEQEVLAAYQAFIDTWFTANDPPDPTNAAIDLNLTGDAKALLLSEIEKNRRSGVVLRRPTNTATGIVDASVLVEGESARLHACVVDDGEVLLAANGAALNSRTVTRKIEAILSHDGSRWRVARNAFIEEQEGLKSCDAS